MTTGTFALISLTVIVAAFVQGSTGVGFALIVAPVIAVLAPQLIPVGLLVLMLPLNAYFAWRERAAIDRVGAKWITCGRLLGTFGGLWILAIFAAYLNIVVGAATVFAALLSLLAPAFDPNRKTYIAAGVVTGITETASGIGGPPLALIYQHQAPATFRSTIALCFLVGELISIAFLWLAGQGIGPEVVEALWFAPALLVGAFLSRFVHRRVNARALRVFVLLFAAISGCVLLLRG